MSEQLQLRRGSAAQVASFTGAQGEVVVDTTNNRLVVQDGSTAGGFAAAKLSEVLPISGGEIAGLGIGTTLDPNNALSVYGSSALFSASASFNLTVNKAAANQTASVIFEDGFSGRAQIGLCGDDNFHFKVSADGNAWYDALDIAAASGVVSAPKGFAFNQTIGFRNRLRNATFLINQRNVSGTVTLAAGAYGHDGLKAGANGAAYTFAQTGADVTITITAGSLIMPIEAASIEGGVYTLSQAGSAPARVWQGNGYTGSGAYAATPFTTAALGGGNQTNVEFSTGTVLRPQLEPGSFSTAFERRPVAIEYAICRRYLRTEATGVGTAYNATTARMAVAHEGMASAPTVFLLAPLTITDIYASNPNQSAANVAVAISNTPDGGQYDLGNFSNLTIGRIYFFIPGVPLYLSAEI